MMKIVLLLCNWKSLKILGFFQSISRTKPAIVEGFDFLKVVFDDQKNCHLFCHLFMGKKTKPALGAGFNHVFVEAHGFEPRTLCL